MSRVAPHEKPHRAHVGLEEYALALAHYALRVALPLGRASARTTLGVVSDGSLVSSFLVYKDTGRRSAASLAIHTGCKDGERGILAVHHGCKRECCAERSIASGPPSLGLAGLRVLLAAPLPA